MGIFEVAIGVALGMIIYNVGTALLGLGLYLVGRIF